MAKKKTTITIAEDVLEFLREEHQSPRKISIVIEKLVREEIKRRNPTESEIYQEISRLNKLLSVLKDKSDDRIQAR